MFLQDPNLSDVDISPKEFLKRVEQTVKHKQSGTTNSGESCKSSMHSTSNSINNSPEGVKLFDGTVTDGRQHPPTSIYAQQQFLPYTNNHPNSDYVPQQLNMRYHQPAGPMTSPPRRMDSHESFASAHSYQPQHQQDAIPQHRYVPHHNHHQQYHHHHQQSPLNTTPAVTNPTASSAAIPTPSL